MHLRLWIRKISSPQTTKICGMKKLREGASTSRGGAKTNWEQTDQIYIGTLAHTTPCILHHRNNNAPPERNYKAANSQLAHSKMDPVQGNDKSGNKKDCDDKSSDDKNSAQNSMLVASLCLNNLKQFGLLSPSWTDAQRQWPLIDSQAAGTSSLLMQPMVPSTSLNRHFEPAKPEEPKFDFHKLAESATKDKVKKKSRPKKEYICR